MSGDEAVCDALPVCCQLLGLRGLACLAASSRQLQTAILEMIPKDGRMLLEAALKAAVTAASAAASAAAAAPPAAIDNPSAAAGQTPPAAPVGASRSGKEFNQCLQAVIWLLSLTPEAATTAGMTELALQIQAVPLHWAKQLLAAGMTVSYAQLVRAAHSMVAGVEVWVQAQQALGLQEDIPEAAVTICCPSTWPSEPLPYLTEVLQRNSTPDLLQLAMNCSMQPAAEAAARSLPAQLEPQHICKLLTTAAKRQHVSAAANMLELAAVQQHIDAAAGGIAQHDDC
uniref:Uncharacterized protein n=1 Tax=Tetradesmus obliquus TaxID=3088 RepID=A0A383WK41_TETOB|eukprot:jgi/Sobl393_1/11792/SZX70353.1